MDTRPPLAGSALLLAAAPLLAMHSTQGDEGDSFEAPVLLMHGEVSLGATLKYPSPTLHDLNGDGERVLVVGDLTGRIRVASRQADAPDTAWGELVPLKTDGKEIEFHNW